MAECLIDLEHQKSQVFPQELSTVQCLQTAVDTLVWQTMPTSSVDIEDVAPASHLVDNMQLEIDMTAATALTGAWTFVPLTLETAQVALDAVRYQNNYARTVTIRLCLHYINTIRKRVSSNITSYLFSIDGCELAQVEPTGRCDIYYCRPYTYELQLAQKAVGSDVFIVQSIYKTVDQKSLDELRETSNLDFSTAPEAAAGIESIFYPEEAPVETGLPTATDETLNKQNGDKHQVASAEVSKFLVSQPIPTPPLSLRVDSLSMAAMQTENASAGSTTVIAIVGITAVAVSMVAFVVALVLVRRQARANASRFALNQEYSPLSGEKHLPTITEGTVSISSSESIASDTKPDVEELTGFFI